MPATPTGGSRAQGPTGLPAPDLQLAEYDLKIEDITVEKRPFGFRFTPDSEAKERLCKTLSELCAEFSEDDYADDPERWCAVKGDEGEWYRGEVLCCYSDENAFVTHVEVFLVDEGYADVLPIANIFPLDKSLLKIPPQSVRVIPDRLRVVDIDGATSLLEDYPDMRLKVEVKPVSMRRATRAHAAGVLAVIKVGYEAWMDFGELCSRLGIGHVEDSDDEDNDSENEYEDRFGDTPSNSTESVASGPEQEEVLQVKSDESVFSDGFASACETVDATQTGDSVRDVDPTPNEILSPARDVNGHSTEDLNVQEEDTLTSIQRQQDAALARNLQLAEKVKLKNQRTTRPCLLYARTGNCPQGDLCPFVHDNKQKKMSMPESAMTLRECPTIDLDLTNPFFAIVTHVDESFCFFIVQIYGNKDIWSVLECKNLDLIPIDTIQQNLADFYQPLRSSRKVGVTPMQGEMVSVYIENEGELTGWHRGKLLEVDIISHRMKIRLIDHGCIVKASPMNIFKLDAKFLDYPKQAIHCRLADTKPTLKATPKEVLRRLQRQILIVKVSESSGSEYIVEMFSDSGTKAVNEELVHANLMTWDTSEDSI